MPKDRTVLYFDGVCNLCSGVVQFFIRRDRLQRLYYASLQSPAGQRAIAEAAASGTVPDSVLLYHKGKYYMRSAAVLRALALLGGSWKLSVLGFLIPRFIRDAVYNLVARKRYRWFGRKEACMIPEPGMKERFLED